jgi:hypothetical protein
MDIEIHYVRWLLAVKDVYTLDFGERLRVLGQMSKERTDGEEHSGVVFFNGFVFVDAENTGV